MVKDRRLNLIGMALLLGATLAWGTSFFILKQTIENVPAFYVISVRFMVSALVFALVFVKKMKAMEKITFYKGVILGCILAMAYITQTIGLKYTTPGRNAFLTSTYCVTCPFLIWILFKKKPKFYNIFAAVVCIIGVGLIALSGESSSGKVNQLLLGDGLTLVGSIFYGLQIVYIDKFQKDGSDSIKLLVPEIFTAGVITAFVTLCFELPFRGIGAYALNADQIWRIAYLTLACTIFAQFAQILGQKYTSPNQCSIILTFESVFGVLFSVLFADEKLTALILLGFIVIFIAMLISELHLDPIELFKRKNKKIKAEEFANDYKNILDKGEKSDGKTTTVE